MTREPKPVLSTVDCIALIVGLVIGAGIFRLPSVIAGAMPDERAILLVWLAGGLISVLGALCYAELATAYPSAGGEYHFLTRAYGARVGFLFSWARITVIQSGSIALFAYVFGDYATSVLPLGFMSAAVYAFLVVVVLTGINLVGVRETARLQKVLFAATVIGLSAIIVTALFPAPSPPAAVEPIPVTFAGVSTAMLLVLLTFGGWNEAAYISAEVRSQRRGILHALLVSIAIITALYVGVNYAYLAVLGVEGVAASKAVAADLMRVFMGEAGALAITAVVLVVVLDNTHITIFTGARSVFAFGRDFPLFGFAGRWNTARGVPVAGVLTQGGFALIIVLIGAYSRKGIETVVDFLQPVFWVFFLLTGFSLFVLRWRDGATARPFRVPLYPVVPALFCLVGVYMLYASVVFTGRGALLGVVVLLVGVPVMLLARRRVSDRAVTSATTSDTLA